MLHGLYPALITPFTPTGEVDHPSLARIIARSEDAGCQGVVVGGTNGESPALSAVEKRDLVRAAVATAGSLTVVAGLGTESLPEAIWLADQARKAGAIAALAMPPRFWQPCDPKGIFEWFSQLLDKTSLPVVLYHYPKRSGFSVSPEAYAPLLQHPNCAGLKDSSGDRDNLAALPGLVRPGQALMMGDERLLVDALHLGWTGSISGLGNAIPHALARMIQHPDDEAWSAIIAPLLAELRGLSQPAHHKQLLFELGVIGSPTVRPPLQPAEPQKEANLIERVLGKPR